MSSSGPVDAETRERVEIDLELDHYRRQQAIVRGGVGYGFTVLLQGVVALLLEGETERARQALEGITDGQRSKAAEIATTLAQMVKEQP